MSSTAIFEEFPLQSLIDREFRDLEGCRVEALIPVSEELLNLLLEEVHVPSVRSICISDLEDGILSIRVKTSIPLFREKVIRLHPLPASRSEPLTMRIEVLGGLNRTEQWLMSHFSSKDIQARGSILELNLEGLVFRDSPWEPLASSIEHLQIRAQPGRVEISLLFHHPAPS